MRISDWSSDVCSSDLPAAMGETFLRPARWIALLLPAALVGGAWIGQLFFGLYPCEMCHWQRWPPYAAIALALLAFAVPGRVNQRCLVGLAAVAIALSGAMEIGQASCRERVAQYL